MANEELTQRGYLATGSLRGDPFGDFEELNVGATRVSELVAAGVDALVPGTIDFPFKEFKPPKTPTAAKPDRLFLRRENEKLRPVAVTEYKAPAKFATDKAILSACEQAFFNSAALGVHVAVATNGSIFHYVDVEASALASEIVRFNETRDFNPAVLRNLLDGDAGVVKDPRPLAETVWQIIWHATKAEPKACLLTFVEIFVLKFLSDNLPAKSLPDAYRFYTLSVDPAEFARKHGGTAIEYYVSTVRPYIKTLFPDNVVVRDPAVPALFGLQTLVSKTSVINGFAFLRSSGEALASFNRTFLEILAAFQTFGPLTAIDPEFKLRLYETFLKRSARQEKLGQFFTPRNVVRPMIRMARLDDLEDGSVVMDPAAGVGGFILEPLLFEDALPGNVQFGSGKVTRRVTTVGVDVDSDLHILAKANMLLHLAEALREASTTVPALNTAMADTFVLMNSNETLGSLEHPPLGSVDVILTNPPYVTEGSGIYRKEIAEIQGLRNGLDLRDYYEGSGLGLESMFMRYIAGALKEGGRAFIVVPLGLLNRTAVGPKARLLAECNIVASIQLPRNAFFNTPQQAYILVLEKRFSLVDPRPPVFCALSRSIGETLDYQRVPTPDDNDLADVAEAFVAFANGDPALAEASPVIKIVAATEFSRDDRWDVMRFWEDEELVQLGEKAAAITRVEFVEEARQSLEQIAADFDAARAELDALTAVPTKLVDLSDDQLFVVRSGTRITNATVRENPGAVPVYSCFTNQHAKKGDISADWLDEQGIPIEDKTIVTVMANGAKAVGKVFVREPGCVITDDVIAVEVIHPDLDLEYVAEALRGAIARGGFLYEAKLFVRRVKELSIEVPVDQSGAFDIEQQRVIASAVKRFDSIRDRLGELGNWSSTARIR